MKNTIAALVLGVLAVLSFATPATAAEEPTPRRTVLAAKGLQGAALTPLTTIRVYLDNGRVRDFNRCEFGETRCWVHTTSAGTPRVNVHFGSVVGWVQVPVRTFAPGVVVIDR